jgi:hypothetical protein
VECVTEQQLLLLASSWGGVSLGMALTLMQGSGGSGEFVYQAQVHRRTAACRCCCMLSIPPPSPPVSRPVNQVSTSSSRVVKLLGDAACVRTLMLDTCGCDARLSLSPPPQAAVGADWGCSDAAAIAGMRVWLRALHCRCSRSRCLQGSGAPSRLRAKPPPAEPLLHRLAFSPWQRRFFPSVTAVSTTPLSIVSYHAFCSPPSPAAAKFQ